MEAPTPVANENVQFIEKKFLLNDIVYILKIKNEYNYLKFIIDSKDIDKVDFYYEIKFELKDLYSLNKYFRQFDSIEEVIESLKNNENLINEKTNLKTYEISYNNSFMILKLNIYLLSGKVQLINIELKQKKLEDKIIINKLKEYIRYIKSIPEINEIINNYELDPNKKLIFLEMSKIIPKLSDFKFIEKELFKNLNKNKIKLILKFSALKDGDTVQKFHNKCDNIGPNLSIVKTKENLIFGGFTMNNWSGLEINKKDNLSFIFNFQNRKIYHIKQGENATYCDNNSLINFYRGRGCSTLRVSNNFLSYSCNNTCTLEDTAFNGFNSDYELNNGKQCFSISDFEIYEVN